VPAVIIVAAIFGVLAGWHWKLMQRSWQDLRAATAQAKGRIPTLKAARSHHTLVAFWFALAAAILLFAVAQVL
jgi:hypothetical protein